MAKRLGSSAAVHTAEAARASREIENAAATTGNKARNGQCTAATIAYAEMQQAIGRFDAHTRSGGKTYKPVTIIGNAASEFNLHCVRESTRLSGAKREPPPVYHTRQGPPPGVYLPPGVKTTLKGRTRRRRR